MSITKATNSGLVGTKYNNVSADNYYMEPIASTLVGSGGQATISFTNIPQGYKHLQVRFIARTTFAAANQDPINMRFNSDTGSNYAFHSLVGDGSGVGAAAGTSQTSIFAGIAARGSEPSNVFGAGVIDILDYTNTNKYTTTRTLTGEDASSGSDEYIGIRSGLWMNTAAITSIDLFSPNGNMAQYSRFSLYGIRG